MDEIIRKRFDESIDVIRRTAEHLAEPIARAVETIVACVRSGGGVLLFGNGGSAAEAQHVAGELVGRFLLERRAVKAIALTTDTSVLTSLANDYAFERVFSRQLEALGSADDVAVALSTSGRSPSIVDGLRTARRIGMKTIALTGQGGGPCAELADVLLDVPGAETPRIQEAHGLICHVLCEMVERALAA